MKTLLALILYVEWAYYKEIILYVYREHFNNFSHEMWKKYMSMQKVDSNKNLIKLVTLFYRNFRGLQSRFNTGTND